MAVINKLGDEEQRKRMLTPGMNFDKIYCFGLTEPDNGSDASGLKTTATKLLGDGVHRECFLDQASSIDSTVYNFNVNSNSTEPAQVSLVEPEPEQIAAESLRIHRR